MKSISVKKVLCGLLIVCMVASLGIDLNFGKMNEVLAANHKLYYYDIGNFLTTNSKAIYPAGAEENKVKARYIKIQVYLPNQDFADTIVRIPEVEIYDVNGSNVALNKTATAIDYNSAGESPAQAVDGSTATHWCSSTVAVDKWLQIDLGQEYEITRYVVKHAESGGEIAQYNTLGFALKASTDGTNWEDFGGEARNFAAITDKTIERTRVTKYAYDFMQTAAAFQGIVNTPAAGDKVFYKYLPSREVCEPLSFHPDDFWMTELSKPGKYLESYNKITVDNFYTDMFDVLKSNINGIVLWDENVPSTSNVAATIAGVHGYLPIRYDTSSNSFYTEFTTKYPDIPVKVNLVGKFTGTGIIADTTRTSTGSKKNDAYIWLLEKYIKTKLINPTLMVWAVDAWSDLRDSRGEIMYKDLFNRMVINSDYYIAKKGLIFDLQPRKNYIPNDDPTQTMDTDYNTLEEILAAMRANTDADENGRVITIGGFAPWHLKYTSVVDPNGMPPIESEWGTLELYSKYYAQKDGDAPGLMALANASIYTHVPKNIEFKQNNDKGYNGKKYDPNKRYIAFYMGDYDAGAWATGELPALWNRSKRGEIPLGWTIVPNLEDRVPNTFNYLYETATPNDYFISGDNGAGYLNPELLPSQYHADWEQYNTQLFNKYDLSIAGFIITGYNPKLTEASQKMYSNIAPDGVGVGIGYDYQIYNDTPYDQVWDLRSGHVPSTPEQIELGFLHHFNANSNEKFWFFRTILIDPNVLVDGVNLFNKNHPEMNVEVVDPFTYYRFYKEAHGGYIDTSSLAYKKTATANDYNSEGEAPEYAVNGSMNNHWCSSVVGDKWLTVDLGEQKEINRWTVRHAEDGGETAVYNTKDFKLQISNDGVNFTDVDTVTGNTAKVTDRIMSSVTVRYVRLYITSPNQIAGDNVARIRQFAVFNENVDLNSLSYNKPVIATNYNGEGERPENAISGSLNDHWCSTSYGDRSLTVDLGTQKQISRWVVRHAGAWGEPIDFNTKDYKLQVSNDGVNFTDVDIVSGNIANDTDRIINTVTARYVRVYITTPNQIVGDPVVRIRQFAVY